MIHLIVSSFDVIFPCIFGEVLRRLPSLVLSMLPPIGRNLLILSKSELPFESKQRLEALSSQSMTSCITGRVYWNPSSMTIYSLLLVNFLEVLC